jgi:putative ABC transport system substrate-binding protein
MMKRRWLIGTGALWVASLASHAQSARKVYRIGIFGLGMVGDGLWPQPRSPTVAALLRGMRELGYVYGENFVTELRSAESRPERYPAAAAELVGLQVDVIVAPGPGLAALKQATSTLPIVMAGAVDPVGDGLVLSLGRPGRNFTGLSNQSVETTGKRLQLLKKMAPGAAPVAVLWDQTARQSLQAAESAARERGWKLLPIGVRAPGELEAAFKAATNAHAGALLVMGGLAFAQRRRMVELAATHRLPAMYPNLDYAGLGGLIAYGADLNEIWRRAAAFVDKILKGARPADLPVEQPTKFGLAINLKSAKALCLTLAQALLLRADEVID